MMMQYAKLTPALWEIGKQEEVDLGNIAWPMLEECIRSGKAMYKGANGPVADLAPDYQALKKIRETESCDEERRFFIKAWNGKYKPLCELFRAQKYLDMVVLVGGEMAKLAATEGPEERERYERHKRELEELAKKWKAEH